jgi:hypothetical protein
MVSFHPQQEEAHLLYYRSVPARFQPLDEPSTIRKPDLLDIPSLQQQTLTTPSTSMNNKMEEKKISKKKNKTSESVKSFVFKHHRSHSGASGSFDSVIRNIIH